MADAPAPAPSAEDELATKILRQVEYYFSDDSYPFDDYIRSQETDGWTPLATIAAFKKMVSYTTDLDVIRSALKASDAIDLDDKGDNLKRRYVTPDQDPNKERTVHASGFGVDGGKDAVEKNIGKALERFGSVEDVRALRNLSQDGRLLDGSAFVRFAKKEDAESAVEMSGCVISGRKIGLMPSVDWFTRLEKKRASMKKKREEKDKRPPVPKKENIPGCVLRFEKLESVPECSREDLRSCCEKAGGQVKYVEFSRGDAIGHVRLGAPGILEKLTSEPFIKDVKVSASVLDGDAEKDYYARLEETAAASRKRGGGRRGGGRRGKRQRN